MKALHFGAGNIGRGFIGKLLADAGIELVFADVNQTVLDALNARHEYPVHVVGEQANVDIVTGVSAVNSTSDDIIPLIAEVDLVTTAVGPQILERIATSVAKGLAKRSDNGNVQPLNIIACENMVRGTSQLKQHVLQALPSQYHAWLEAHVGFVDSAVDRIVPPSEAGSEDPLEVTVETFSEWIVDKTQFKGDLPTIPGMELTDNLMAFVERKLLHSTPATRLRPTWDNGLATRPSAMPFLMRVFAPSFRVPWKRVARCSSNVMGSTPINMLPISRKSWAALKILT